MLTRTIKVSCLSCFLHDSEPLTGPDGTGPRPAVAPGNVYETILP